MGMRRALSCASSIGSLPTLDAARRAGVMSVMATLFVSVAGLGLTGLAAALAYRLGYRRARPSFPAALRHELACHKADCLGEPPARVERELLLFLGRPA